MNRRILDSDTQSYINTHLNDDVRKISMAKSAIDGVSPQELANQVSAKRRSAKKLPTWFKTPGIYYPSTLSIEQTSSETTANYKASLAYGDTLIDLTGGFGVDGYYFARKLKQTTHCEIDQELLEIAAHNASALNQLNTTFISADGLEYLSTANVAFDTI